jgi:hypothetical protein
VIGEERSPVYALMVEVSVEDGDVEARLSELKDELGVDITVHPIETDVL